ncbi:hypothetical protein SXCC_01773 [Gluconacetobacter sp. SXCC-1]|nr:hypothetical protein SXCC_01773 [Gluconacetobacter sp. SXCC-1]
MTVPPARDGPAGAEAGLADKILARNHEIGPTPPRVNRWTAGPRKKRGKPPSDIRALQAGPPFAMMPAERVHN